MRLWCELAWLGGPEAQAGVLLEIDGERIAAVDTGAEPPPGAERLAGLTLPGLANAHSHSFQRALRGRTQAGTGSFWTWRDQMYALAEGIDPDTCLALARATFSEMALAGITCVGEFHYLHHGPGGTPYEDPNAMGEAVITAAAEAGVRLTLLDACYLHGGIGRFRDRDADAWAARASELSAGPQVRIGAAIHSVRAVDPESARAVAEWAAGRPLHAHVSEQPGENEQCLADHGRTPTRVLADAEALSEAFTAIHATHPTEADVTLLGGSGCTVCLCPTTERDLAACAPPARWIDVFCETGAFDAVQSRAVLEAGRAAGLGLRVHGNQLGPGPGAQLAVELGAASVDHCTHLTDADVEALAAGNTVATFLPATDFSTRQPYPDARRVLDAGARVAIATNCNPGSSYTTAMGFCLALAVRDMGMTADEALAAATLGGARALRRTDVGHLAPGARGDAVVLDAPSHAHLVYRPGVPLVAATVTGGEVLHGGG